MQGEPGSQASVSFDMAPQPFVPGLETSGVEADGFCKCFYFTLQRLISFRFVVGALLLCSDSVFPILTERV